MEQAQYDNTTSEARQKEFREKGLVDSLPQSLFKKNRAQFIRMFKEALGDQLPAKAIGFFKGASEVPMYSGDVPYPEYQEAFFYYLFGVTEMEAYGAIDFNAEKVVLFMPKLDNFYKIWMTTLSKEEFKQKYTSVDEIYYTDEVEQYFKDMQPDVVYLNKGVNTDSGLNTLIAEEAVYKTVCPNAKTDAEIMHDILAESRTIKNDEEIEIMRWATTITCEAHCNVMRNVKPGQRESQLESFFVFDGQQKYFTGRVQPYTSICGCGPNAATLHYNENNDFLQDGQMMLTDQGHQVHHYTSDVTTSFPVNGKFTKKQAEIYDLALKANRAVLKVLKPGTDWREMHLLAERVTLEGLKELGLLQGDVDEMVGGRLGFIFQPCGLGHLIGLDIHDVGGYLDGKTPDRDPQPGLNKLRTTREMKAGMCMTIEPGIYFRDFLLDGELDPKYQINIDLKYLNREKIREYQAEVGGVRIEDVVLVTEEGCELLSFGLPRTVEEIESCMRGEDWTKVAGGKM